MALKISGVNKFASSGLKANAGSWAGLFNSYYWVDREAGKYGILGPQVLPFYDSISIEILLAFEQAVYQKD